MGAGNGSYPSYRCLLESGELEGRIAAALEMLSECSLCPRKCGAARLEDERGVCGIGRLARVACHFPHHGEEDCLRGWGGSGTIFFCGCSLGCSFCQNWETSHDLDGDEVSPERLAEMMLRLEFLGCHNINWVTPTHVLPQALEALLLAARSGLRTPIVYNVSGYDDPVSLRLLDGVVDIYMPDFKLWGPESSERLLGAEDYPEVARRAILEMHRQVGDLTLDDRGIARRGLLVRHLVLPGGLAETASVARWLAEEVSPETYINVMGQYHPAGAVVDPRKADRYADIARPVTADEHQRAIAEASLAGLRRLDSR